MMVGVKVKRKKVKSAGKSQRKQLNLRVEAVFYRALESIARQERRSVPQAARQLLEEGLHQRIGGRAIMDDPTSQEIATLAAVGGAFDWLVEEPDLYDDTCGEPL
jgi:hypothetical protein